MSKRMVVLANSRKLSGRCVACKDEEGNWIRLTKNRHDPIPVQEAKNYGILKVLDVDGISSQPSSDFRYHSENTRYTNVTVVSKFDKVMLNKFVDYPNDIFGNGRCISELQAQRLDHSLLFVKVINLRIYINSDDKLRGQFIYNDKLYTDISVTDSAVEKRFKKYSYPHKEDYYEAYITVSLGEIYYDYAYKLISGVIIP
jgi:hypothetical protein